MMMKTYSKKLFSLLLVLLVFTFSSSFVFGAAASCNCERTSDCPDHYICDFDACTLDPLMG
ncbi:MAG: hypothetical protein KKC26_01375, partial [Nanoarchaeota archaeon]|nr:hypothetical protein [Nanoarchaeota archaeon]